VNYAKTLDIEAGRPIKALSRALERPVRGAKNSQTRKRVAVTVEAGGARHYLELIWVGHGWPSDLDDLEHVRSPWPRDLVVAARRFSPGALERLSELNANWVDEFGRAHIEGPSGLFVVRDAPLGLERREKTFKWSASAEQIGERLLARPSDNINARELAAESGWSHAQVSNVLRQFDSQGWTQKTGASRGRYAHRSLADPSSLLEAWADYAGRAKRERILAHRVMRDPAAFLRDELGPALVDVSPWAASGWVGLELAAPFTTAVPALQIYVDQAAVGDGRLRKVMASLRLREVDEGARVEFWAAAPAVLTLATDAKSLPVVSAPRLYADLLALGGRGEDAAAHVREELIGF
jgi:transcriptional regulator with AbiEi antitoxin domain of type IV toxin-antitoxin system